ncbi:MAG: serine/threonine-protein kinase [Actinoplanes sp.]
MGRMERNGQDDSLLIGGRYRLVEKLGTGGMSEVWRGYDETLGRSVAVKVLSPRLADDRTFRDRLRQEALAAARLNHPHITGVFDFGESPLSEQLTVPYVVMELNDGESLSARIARQGPLLWRDAATVAAEVASALATAHARGLVHRDVTPANVMLTGAGAKVVDFGISAVVGQRDAAPDGSLLGTPAYLAPERLGGTQVSAATDVYALGLLLYRSLTGRLPWPAETTAEALRAHLYADPDPLPALPGLPDAVRELCLRCLAKAPAERPRAADAARVLAAEVGMQLVVLPPPTHDASVRGAVGSVGAAPLPASSSPSSSPGLGRALLAYLGLPGGQPGPRPTAGVLRLRTGLKVGQALRLGGARPLGGGLFAGGGLLRGVRVSLPGRYRVQATVLTVALLGMAGAGWASSREAPTTEQAQAAGAGAAAGLPGSPPCAVRYQLKSDSGSDYEAVLTVATTDEVGSGQWRVQFSYPGSQQLTRLPRSVTQKGRRVVAKGRGTLRTFTLRGSYDDYNPLPLTYTLDGRHRCRVEILGSVTGDGAPGRTVSEQRSTRSESRTHHKGKQAGPGSPPPPLIKGDAGFSLALESPGR